MQDSPRIAELRRRVHADPASIAFAQLAEEYRRAGHYHEAVKYCRTGLARHPGYLSARVTLGRSLTELGDLDDAAREFDLVLHSAPDTLAAIRGMAEIHQRRGAMEAALGYYKRARALARFDPELEESVDRLAREIGSVGSLGTEGLAFEEAASQLLSAAPRMPPVEPPPVEASGTEPSAPSGSGSRAPALPEPLIDFDALLASLGLPDAPPPPGMDSLLSGTASAPVMPDAVHPDPAGVHSLGDPFAALERDLRSFNKQTPALRAAPEQSTKVVERPISRTNERIVNELDAWLRVLKAQTSPTA